MTANVCASRWLSNVVLVAATTFALQVGTGGAATESYYKNRGERGYAFGRYRADVGDEPKINVRSPSENISRIRSVFKSSVTDLANLFGVSRQAIYDWQSEKSVAADNAEKLRQLSSAVDIISAEDLTNPANAVRRKISGGKTLFEIVKDGGSAEEAALSLVKMLRRESEQRSRLNARLGDRTYRKLGADKIGAPMLIEEG